MISSVAIAAPQMISIGPNCFIGGIVSPSTRLPAVTSTWRLSLR